MLEYACSRQVDTMALIGWMEQTVRRMAMMTVDDLISTLEVLRRTEELGTARGVGFVRSSPIIGDLMKVWISGSAMNLRRKIRLILVGTASGQYQVT